MISIRNPDVKYEANFALGFFMQQNRIRQLRKKRHMTQVRLSIELNVSQETISGYESGKYTPSFATLERLSDLFGESIDYIMGRDDTCNNQVNAVTSDEKTVILAYQKLNQRKKDLVLAYLQGLLAE